jgi:hypothetical protein
MKDPKACVAKTCNSHPAENGCEELLKAKVDKYLERAGLLFAGLAVNPELSPVDSKKAAKVLDTAKRYYSDSRHFYGKGEYLSALTALEYGEGWMDAGLEVGFLVREEQE